MPRFDKRFYRTFPSFYESARIVLVGCGAIAEEYYLPVLSVYPAILRKLILVDSDLSRAQQLANKFKVNTCMADYQKVPENIDGAIIAVPIHLHHPISMEFLRRGKPVLCEKPLAESLEKARELVLTAKRKKTVLAVNYLQRLIPSFSKVKEILESKALGDILSIKYTVCEEFNWPTVSGFYFNSSVASRGILRDRGCHIIDHICWWLGCKPDLLRCRYDSFGGSEAVVDVTFKSGQCKGEIKLSWFVNALREYSVICEKGTLGGDIYDYRYLIVKNNSNHEKRVLIRSRIKTKLDIAFKIITNFIEVITNGENPVISGSDVLDSMEFIDECYTFAEKFDMPWYDKLEIKDDD